METILCIPGKWETEQEFVGKFNLSKSFSIEKENIIFKSKEKKLEYLFQPFDAGLFEAFQSAGQATMAPDDIESIQTHKSSIYIISEIESREDCKDLIETVAEIVRTGGIGVKVESAIIAHSAKRWLEFAKVIKSVDLFHAFVSILKVGNKLYSCGMHTLGYPDAEITFTPENEDKAYGLIRNFLFQVVNNQLEVDTEKNYTVYNADPNFLIHHKKDVRFNREDLIYNPKGLWEFIKK